MPRAKKSNRSDGRYEVRRTIGYTADGNRILKSFYGKNKDEAVRKYIDYKEAEERKRIEQKNVTFAEWADKWLYTFKAPDVKPTTFATTYERPCRLHIIPYFNDRLIKDITQLDIKEFINSIVSMSQSTLDKVLICLKGIFETAIDNDIILRNPCRNIKAKSRAKKAQKRTYDKESVEVLCASTHKYALYVHILLALGLRCSELCGLTWEDVDFERGMVHIQRALTTDAGTLYISDPKSFDSNRELKIPPSLLERMKQERGEGFIAMKKSGKHVTPDHFAALELEAFYNSLKVPNDKRLTPHELRHTCGTLLYEDTKDIYHVSKFLGHSDIGITTKTYVHSDMTQKPIHLDI